MYYKKKHTTSSQMHISLRSPLHTESAFELFFLFALLPRFLLSSASAMYE